MQAAAENPNATPADREKYLGYSVMSKLLNQAITDPDRFREMHDKRKMFNAARFSDTIDNIYKGKVQSDDDVQELIAKLASGKTLSLYEQSATWQRKPYSSREEYKTDVDYWTEVTKGFMEDVLSARNGAVKLSQIQTYGAI